MKIEQNRFTTQAAKTVPAPVAPTEAPKSFDYVNLAYDLSEHFVGDVPCRASTLVYLANRRNHKTGALYPPQLTIAKQTGYGERHVRDAIRFWESLGVITTVRGGRGNPNRYEFHYDKGKELLARVKETAEPVEEIGFPPAEKIEQQIREHRSAINHLSRQIERTDVPASLKARWSGRMRELESTVEALTMRHAEMTGTALPVMPRLQSACAAPMTGTLEAMTGTA